MGQHSTMVQHRATVSATRGTAYYSGGRQSLGPTINGHQLHLLNAANANCYTSVMVRGSTSGAFSTKCLWMAKTVGGVATGYWIGHPNSFISPKVRCQRLYSIYVDSGATITFNVGDVLTTGSNWNPIISVLSNDNLLASCIRFRLFHLVLLAFAFIFPIPQRAIHLYKRIFGRQDITAAPQQSIPGFKLFENSQIRGKECLIF